MRRLSAAAVGTALLALAGCQRLNYEATYDFDHGVSYREAEFDPPRGLFLVGWLDGAAVACGGWRVHTEPVAGRSAVEVKRMYVAAPARRRGVGRLLLAELERTAVAAGHGYAVLSTGIGQPEAIAMYEACGYRAVPPFGHYRSSRNARFLGKPLVEAAG